MVGLEGAASLEVTVQEGRCIGIGVANVVEARESLEGCLLGRLAA